MRLTDILFRDTDRDPDTLRIKESRRVGDRNIVRFDYPIDWHKILLCGLGGALSLYLIAEDLVKKPSCLDYAYAVTTNAILNTAGHRHQSRAVEDADPEDVICESRSYEDQSSPTAGPTQGATPYPTPTAILTNIPDAAPTQKQTTPSVQIMKNYEVQIAACRIRSNAARLFTAIVEEGIDDVTLAEENIDLMPFYKVKFGSFENKEDAKDCKYDLERRISDVMRKFKIDDLRIVEREVYVINVSSAEKQPRENPISDEEAKEKFIDGLKKFMLDVNSRYVAARYTDGKDVTYHSLTEESSSVWANAIYDVMDKYNLPPEFIKIFAHEGGFDPNALGDLKHKWGPSDGPAQILMESQLEIWKGLTRDGYEPPEGYVLRDIQNDPYCEKTKARWKKAKKTLPDDMPDIRADPRIYCEFAARRFRECLDNQYNHAISLAGDENDESVDETEVIRDGVGAYNAGPRTWTPDKKGYTDKVYSITVPQEIESFAVSRNDGDFLSK